LRIVKSMTDGYFDIKEEIKRYLKPRKTLAPWIFDKKGIMHEDLRKGLLKIADKVIEQTIGIINGLEVFDICLTGSSSGYLYKDDSDIDMQIMVRNVSCPDFCQDPVIFNKFLVPQGFALREKKYTFRFHERFVDIKLSGYGLDFLSLYSIKDNKWLITPSKDYAKGLNAKEIEAYYLERKKILLDKLEKIRAENQAPENIKNLREGLHQVYDEAYNNEKNFKDFIVAKLFDREGLIKPLFREIIETYNEEYRCMLSKEPIRLNLPPI